MTEHGPRDIGGVIELRALASEGQELIDGARSIKEANSIAVDFSNSLNEKAPAINGERVELIGLYKTAYRAKGRKFVHFLDDKPVQGTFAGLSIVRPEVLLTNHPDTKRQKDLHSLITEHNIGKLIVCYLVERPNYYETITTDQTLSTVYQLNALAPASLSQIFIEGVDTITQDSPYRFDEIEKIFASAGPSREKIYTEIKECLASGSTTNPLETLVQTSRKFRELAKDNIVLRNASFQYIYWCLASELEGKSFVMTSVPPISYLRTEDAGDYKGFAKFEKAKDRHFTINNIIMSKMFRPDKTGNTRVTDEVGLFLDCTTYNEDGGRYARLEMPVEALRTADIGPVVSNWRIEL